MGTGGGEEGEMGKRAKRFLRLPIVRDGIEMVELRDVYDSRHWILHTRTSSR